jgi:hypothetical protein
LLSSTARSWSADVCGDAPVEQLGIGLAEPVGASGQALAGAVDEQIAPLLVLEENAVRRVLHEVAEALLALFAALARAVHRAAEGGDEKRGTRVGRELDQLRRASEADAPARLHEQHIAPQPSEHRCDERGGETAVPGGHDHRAEQRDVRRSGTEPRVERRAQRERGGYGEHGDEIGQPASRQATPPA